MKDDSTRFAEVNPDDSTFVATLTVAQLKAVIAAVVSPAPAGPHYLDESELFARFGFKKSSADAAGIPRKRVGRKSKWLLTDVEAAIAAKPVAPRPPRKSKPLAIDDDPIAAMLASGELVARRGRR